MQGGFISSREIATQIVEIARSQQGINVQLGVCVNGIASIAPGNTGGEHEGRDIRFHFKNLPDLVT